MGKAADNERIKLRATKYNNISAGLVLGGFALPYLAIVSKLPEFEEWATNWQFGKIEITTTELQRVLVIFFSFGLAFQGAKYFHDLAMKEIRKIKG